MLKRDTGDVASKSSQGGKRQPGLLSNGSFHLGSAWAGHLSTECRLFMSKNEESIWWSQPSITIILQQDVCLLFPRPEELVNNVAPLSVVYDAYKIKTIF